MVRAKHAQQREGGGQQFEAVGLAQLTCHENRLPSFCAGYSIKVIFKGLLQTAHMGNDARADGTHHDDMTLHLLNKQAYE